MSDLRLLLFGSAQVIRAGRPEDLSAAKAIALLAYLAVNDTAQRREHLADLLWPGSLPDAARKNLRNTLWTIRRTLGDEALSQFDADRAGHIAQRDEIALSAEVWVDTREFEAAVGAIGIAELQEAIELYRAPLLDGLTVSGAPDFELWLTTERERYGQIYLRLLEALVAAHRTQGNWSDVITAARRALSADDLQEPMHRAVMEAHARLGQRAEALRHYDRLRTILAHELGVEPLPETEALRAAILSSDLRAVEKPALLVPARPRRLLEASREPFVGRGAELAALDQELQLAAGGKVRAVLITGELGIGKSRLWQEWSAKLPQGLTVLETRCLDTTQALPFAPLTRLFRQQPCFECLFQSPSPVSPLWLTELARLLPEIRQYWPQLAEPSALPQEEERRRLFEAFTQVLRALEVQPLILFIDDLHWADRATLDWLVYLIDRMAGEGLLFLGAYRPSDAAAQLTRLIAGWNREGIARKLSLARLTPEEATHLAAALGVDPALAGPLLARSAGNPFFLLELSRAAPGETPPGLAELVRSRLNHLPDPARQVLQAAAVLEVDLNFGMLRRTSGRGEEETLDALDVLLDAAVLAERGGGYEFVHPLAASVARDDLNIARRSFLHRRATKALETAHTGNLTPVAGQLARHYAQSGRPAQAAQYAELAARQSLELTAPAEAVDFYRQALTLEPTPSRRLGLGRALALHGDLEGARKALGSALDELEVVGDRIGAAHACLALAESYLPSGQGDQVIQWAEQALPSLDAQRDPESVANACYLLGAGAQQVGRALTQAEVHLARAAQLATENDLPEMAARSEFELGNLFAQRGDLEEAIQAFETSIALSRKARARFLEVLGYNNLAYHTHLAGDLDSARVHIQAGLALAEELSLFLPRQYLYSTRGEIALAEGQYDEARSWLVRALDEAEKAVNEVQAASIRAGLGRVAHAQGNLDEALALLEAANHAAAPLMALYLQTQIDLWLAELHLERSERAAAEQALTRAEARLVDSEHSGLKNWAARVRAALHH